MINGELMPVVNSLKKDLHHYFGNRVSRIFLYGSYARGDYNENSDVDIMVLLNDSPAWTDEKFVSGLSFEYMYNQNVLFSIMLQRGKQFDDVIGFYPFYQNIAHEGILL